MWRSSGVGAAVSASILALCHLRWLLPRQERLDLRLLHSSRVDRQSRRFFSRSELHRVQVIWCARVWTTDWNTASIAHHALFESLIHKTTTPVQYYVRYHVMRSPFQFNIQVDFVVCDRTDVNLACESLRIVQSHNTCNRCPNTYEFRHVSSNRA